MSSRFRALWLAACVSLLGLGVAVPPGADEFPWFAGLVAAAERERSLASALDASTLAPLPTGPSFSAVASAPVAAEWAIGSISSDSSVLLQMASPVGSINAFNWKLGAGGAVSVTRDTASSALFVAFGPMVSLNADLRFAGAEAFSGSPSERLRAIELEGRLRDNERVSASRLLVAADLAARSAAARADAEYAEAKAAYLDRKARRVEIELGEGRQSRADYSEASDAAMRAHLEARSFRHLAESYGREARAAAGLPLQEAPTGGAPMPKEGPASSPSSFSGEDLHLVGTSVAAALSGADPVPLAVATATSPWDLRLSELGLDAINEAPRLSATLALKALPTATNPNLFPEADAALGLAIPFGSSAPERADKAARLSAMRKDAAAAASSSASLRFSEAMRGITLSRERILSLQALASERETRTKSWTRLAAEGVATMLDVLASQASVAEARASLLREKAACFLFAVTAFTVSGKSLGAVADLKGAGS